MTRLETLIDTSTADSAESFLRAHNTPETPLIDTPSVSRLLENKPELPGFIEAWRYKPKAQVKEEMASYCMETLRISDPYRFIVSSNGELLSPVAGCRVKDVVTTNTHVGRLEYEALEKIEQWTASNSTGAIIWVSPPDKDLYPDDSKIVISEIEEKNGIKTLFNRAIVLDIDQEKCIKLAQDLVRYSINKPLLSSTDQIRSNPLILNTSVHWTSILEELVTDLNLTNVRNGEDLAIKEKTLKQAEYIYQEFFVEGMPINARVIAEEMGKRQMVGTFGTSCPNRTAFGTFAESATTVAESCNKIKCGKKGCGWEASESEAQRVTEGSLTCCPRCGWKPGESKS